MGELAELCVEPHGILPLGASLCLRKMLGCAKHLEQRGLAGDRPPYSESNLHVHLGGARGTQDPGLCGKWYGP